MWPIQWRVPGASVCRREGPLLYFRAVPVCQHQRVQIIGVRIMGWGRVLIDYWLASKVGRVRLRVRHILRLRSVDDEMPGLCRRVASGEQLPAGQLQQAEYFAVSTWLWLGWLAILLMLPVGIPLSIFHRARPAATVLSGLLVALVLLLAAAMGQAGMAFFRAAQSRNYLRKADFAARNRALPGDAGAPRRADFWWVLAAAIGFTVVLFMAGNG